MWDHEAQTPTLGLPHTWWPRPLRPRFLLLDSGECKAGPAFGGGVTQQGITSSHVGARRQRYGIMVQIAASECKGCYVSLHVKCLPSGPRPFITQCRWPGVWSGDSQAPAWMRPHPSLVSSRMSLPISWPLSWIFGHLFSISCQRQDTSHVPRPREEPSSDMRVKAGNTLPPPTVPPSPSVFFPAPAHTLMTSASAPSQLLPWVNFKAPMSSGILRCQLSILVTMGSRPLASQLPLTAPSGSAVAELLCHRRRNRPARGARCWLVLAGWRAGDTDSGSDSDTFGSQPDLSEPQGLLCKKPCHSQEGGGGRVAEMHGELIEFNERLHRALVAKEALVSQMRQELIDLRGPDRWETQLPGPTPHQPLGCFSSAHSSADVITTPMTAEMQSRRVGSRRERRSNRALINVWIPSVFLRGKAANAFHVYQRTFHTTESGTSGNYSTFASCCSWDAQGFWESLIQRNKFDHDTMIQFPLTAQSSMKKAEAPSTLVLTVEVRASEHQVQETTQAGSACHSQQPGSEGVPPPLQELSSCSASVGPDLRDAKFVEERRKQLQTYLRSVMNKVIQAVPEFTASPQKETLTQLMPFFIRVGSSCEAPTVHCSPSVFRKYFSLGRCTMFCHSVGEEEEFRGELSSGRSDSEKPWLRSTEQVAEHNCGGIPATRVGGGRHEQVIEGRRARGLIKYHLSGSLARGPAVSEQDFALLWTAYLERAAFAAVRAGESGRQLPRLPSHGPVTGRLP
ncbi:SNX29 [Cervus elaphus hippelaphus]|uniref:SNX29 n=1 Tax=Cervus elaphus hippelaphus TaxID=46360 RepID=A0A212CYL7_CEREH|nr:SNX29 [Cervus elaphus hippelaphus]